MNKLLVTIYFALTWLSAYASSNFFEDLDIQFLIDNCDIDRYERVENGFVPYTIETYECKNTKPSQVLVAKCGKKCRDPIKIKNKRKKSGKANKYSRKKYIPEPVYVTFELNGRNGKNYRFPVPISCRCIKRDRRKKPKQ